MPGRCHPTSSFSRVRRRILSDVALPCWRSQCRRVGSPLAGEPRAEGCGVAPRPVAPATPPSPAQSGVRRPLVPPRCEATHRIESQPSQTAWFATHRTTQSIGFSMRRHPGLSATPQTHPRPLPVSAGSCRTGAGDEPMVGPAGSLHVSGAATVSCSGSGVAL